MLRRLGLLLGFFLLLSSQVEAAKNLVSSLYSIKKIVEFAKADSAGQAQEISKELAKRRAFELLVKRLSAQEIKEIPEISPEDLDNLILSFSVEDEKMSGKHYKAAFSFQFDPVATKSFLQSQGVSVIERSAARLLVIPVLRKSEDVFLWEDNPWLDHWKKNKPSSPLQPYILPQAGVFDRGMWSGEKYPTFSAAEGRAFTIHYQVSGVIILELTFLQGGNAQLVATHYSQGGENKQNVSIDIEGKNIEQLFQAAQAESQMFMEQIGKRNFVHISKSAKVVDVHVPLENADVIQDTIIKLQNIEGIQRIIEREIRSYEVVLGIVFEGTLLHLQDHLRDHGYEMRRRKNHVVLRQLPPQEGSGSEDLQ